MAALQLQPGPLLWPGVLSSGGGREVEKVRRRFSLSLIYFPSRSCCSAPPSAGEVHKLDMTSLPLDFLPFAPFLSGSPNPPLPAASSIITLSPTLALLSAALCEAAKKVTLMWGRGAGIEGSATLPKVYDSQHSTFDSCDRPTKSSPTTTSSAGGAERLLRR